MSRRPAWFDDLNGWIGVIGGGLALLAGLLAAVARDSEAQQIAAILVIGGIAIVALIWIRRSMRATPLVLPAITDQHRFGGSIRRAALFGIPVVLIGLISSIAVVKWPHNPPAKFEIEDVRVSHAANFVILDLAFRARGEPTLIRQLSLSESRRCPTSEVPGEFRVDERATLVDTNGDDVAVFAIDQAQTGREGSVTVTARLERDDCGQVNAALTLRPQSVLSTEDITSIRVVLPRTFEIVAPSPESAPVNSESPAVPTALVQDGGTFSFLDYSSRSADRLHAVFVTATLSDGQCAAYEAGVGDVLYETDSTTVALGRTTTC
jgi:hypothetical protein